MGAIKTVLTVFQISIFSTFIRRGE